MSEKRKNLLPVYLKGLVSHKYTLRQASESTGYTKEYLCALKKRYLQEGFSILENKNKFRPPKNKTPEKIKTQIIKIYSTKYEDVNFKYFCECLKEYENISISYTTLLGIFREYGIKSPRKHKIKKLRQLHQPRIRRQNEGDLIQIDGTPYEWFYKFDNNKKYSLHGAIDDATGNITGLYMTENECLYGYLEILRQTCRNYGIPREIYSDRAAIFCVTPREKKNLTVWEQLAGIHDKRTQWQRILSDLSINQILAWSPQAKGRVERMWLTIQGQLPMWLKLHNADSVEKANILLPQYIKEFNTKYGIPAAIDDPFWIQPDLDLDDILCAQIPRKTNHQGEFSFHSYKFILDTHDVNIACRDFLLCISEHGIFGKIGNRYYPVKIVDKYIHEGDMPQVLENIVYRYMFAFAKELSA